MKFENSYNSLFVARKPLNLFIYLLLVLFFYIELQLSWFYQHQLTKKTLLLYRRTIFYVFNKIIFF